MSPEIRENFVQLMLSAIPENGCFWIRQSIALLFTREDARSIFEEAIKRDNENLG